MNVHYIVREYLTKNINIPREGKRIPLFFYVSHIPDYSQETKSGKEKKKIKMKKNPLLPNDSLLIFQHIPIITYPSPTK